MLPIVPAGAPPLVGLTGRTSTGRSLTTAASFQTAPVEMYFAEYAAAVAAAGGLPVNVPTAADPVAVAGALDGLLLSGGDDVDPRAYGASVGPHTTSIDPDRDEFEGRLLHAFLDAGKPVLGVCRGSQLINVVLGGTLVAHLPPETGLGHASYAYPRAFRRHAVDIVPGTLGHRLYGDRVEVNSFHHQAVADPAPGVRVSGRAPDGVAEMIEVDGRLVLGVQWHPESLDSDPVFAWLVGHAAAVRQVNEQYPGEVVA